MKTQTLSPELLHSQDESGLQKLFKQFSFPGGIPNHAYGRAETGSKEVQPETKTKPPSDVSPRLVKRVHELYEQLGREDVRVVGDLEKAERENRKKNTQN